MAWRIHEYVLRGEIDNRRRGTVSGRIWLAGVEQPLELELAGDCDPDLAGCVLAFENPKPVSMTTKPLLSRQHGTAGTITAARKSRVFDGGIDGALEAIKRGEKPPEHIANTLFIEWFTRASGHVVIESADYRLEISEPVWRFTPQEMAELERRVAENDTPFATAIETDGTVHAWDEVRYEQSLRESDALTERYGRLLEKYGDDVDAERLIAREMGWTWLEEALADQQEQAAEDHGADLEESEESEDDEEEVAAAALDPQLRVSHPIKKRSDVALHALLDELKAAGHFPDSDDVDLGDFVGGYMTVTAKLAGALGGVAREDDIEPGLVIAWLKRVLEIVNETLAAADRAARKTFLAPERMAHYRAELFGIREDILGLIAELRLR